MLCKMLTGRGDLLQFSAIGSRDVLLQGLTGEAK